MRLSCCQSISWWRAELQTLRIKEACRGASRYLLRVFMEANSRVQPPPLAKRLVSFCIWKALHPCKNSDTHVPADIQLRLNQGWLLTFASGLGYLNPDCKSKGSFWRAVGPFILRVGGCSLLFVLVFVRCPERNDSPRFMLSRMKWQVLLIRK